MNCFRDADLKRFVACALKEDIGSDDITAKVAAPGNPRVNAVIVANESGILCGMNIVKLIFKQLDGSVKFSSCLKDAAKIHGGQVIAKINARAQSILSAERTALNFLGFLSGIATATQAFVKKARPFKVKILDTRKTLPGLRALEKYAVRIGGGFNHRFGLDEMILVKENHIDIAGWETLRRNLKNLNKPKIKLEIETRNLKEFQDAFFLKPDIIMLDNMSVGEVRRAVHLRNKISTASPKLEASGNISLNNISAYAASGIDFISLGTLTKDIDSLDFSLAIKK